MRKKRGFTLIEVLIVIAIISIIFAAMVVNISGFQNEAKISRAMGDLKTLQLALEAYYKNYMYEFPPEENYQRTLIEAVPRVLEGNLIDPFGKDNSSLYLYKLSLNGTYYVLYSPGISHLGNAKVDDRGTVGLSWGPVWVSNGHL